MMNELRRKRQILKVDHYDGQCIYSERELYYELGGYLGGGAAGVVYEAFCVRTKRHVAIKILNPVGYKLLPSTLLSRCIVAFRGKPLEPSNAHHDDDDDDMDLHMDDHHMPSFARAQSSYNSRNGGGGGGNLTPGGSNLFSSVSAPMRLENVWWLIHPSSKQAVAAYEDPRTGALRELSLPQCIDVWGRELQVDDFHGDVDRKFAQLENAFQEVQVKNQTLKIPKIPKKFLKFALTRRTIHREICNMSGLGFHENVLRLDEALELVQDSKCTTFLVLELAAGGELFDRIKLDCGTDETTARRYFQQLISGVAFCHSSGVCHRDLKPENLLLADTEEFSTLKIADFGLSAIFAMTEQGSDVSMGQGGNGNSNSTVVAASVQAIRRLRSVVGSPHYVAPEVLMDAGQGYDGAKADAWSIGVIVYAMLAGNLPFGKDLLKCLRYEKFKKWCYNTKYSDEDPVDETVFPTWFFPSQFSLEVKSLVTQLLYPDPSMRLSVDEAQRHAWVLGEQLVRGSQRRQQQQQQQGGTNYSSMLHREDDPAASPMMSPSPSPPSPSPPSLLLNAPHSIAVANVPQNVIDHEQQRWTQQQQQQQRIPSASSSVPMSSPGGYNRHHGMLHLHHGRSPTASSSTLPLGGGMIPASPQKAALRAHLMNGCGYMPSVDETAPLMPSGQTPVNSPRHGDESNIAATPSTSVAQVLQFDMEPSPAQDTDPSTCGTSHERKENTDQEDRQCQRNPSFTSSTTSTTTTQSVVNAAAEATTATTTTATTATAPSTRRRLFTSPPLATGSGCSLVDLERSHYQHRRNSPPELYLSRFGKGFKFEAIQTAFEDVHLLDRSLRQSVVSSSSSSSNSQSVPNTPMTNSSRGQKSPLGGDQTGEGPDATTTTSGGGPPSYQTDHVARSTRFITALPAPLVLNKMEEILHAHPAPLPVCSPHQLMQDGSAAEAQAHLPLQQRVCIDWDKYQLDVRYGDLLTCTVQVFLFQRGVYLVEFRRGQIEIFQFKRFYEEIREKLSDSMEISSSCSPRNTLPLPPSQRPQERQMEEEGDSPQRSFLRKRNKSIGVHAELLR